MNNLPNEIFEHIINYYGNNIIRLVNNHFNEAYQQGSYHKLEDILKSKYKNFPFQNMILK